MITRIRALTAAALAAASVPATMAIFLGAGVADADVCGSIGRRVSVGGCANIADTVEDYVPPPAYYAPLPGDPPPPEYVAPPPPPPPPPNVRVCANVGRRISIGGCV